jgi:DNA-binding Lrp family transcriptional regulator
VIEEDMETADGGRRVALDDKDRRLLTLLAEDATISYTQLGELVHLSAAAVHERVKRLKREGVFARTVARIDGAKIGRPLLAFVHAHTSDYAVARQLIELRKFPEVEEIHTVTGDGAILLKVRTQDTQALERLLAKIHGIKGISGTRSHVALTTYLERGPSPGLR